MKHKLLMMLALLVCTTTAWAQTTLDLSTVTTDITVPNGTTLTGHFNAAMNPVKISIAADATVTLSDATINGEEYIKAEGDEDWFPWSGLTCLGDATIILADGTTNTITSFHRNHSGIHVPILNTLTIRGTGTLIASCYNKNNSGRAAGIGAKADLNNNKDYNSCGDIIIENGTITAHGGSQGGAGIGAGTDNYCGNIIIKGGTITATGGMNAAGIGIGSTNSHLIGNIIITKDVARVTASSANPNPGSIVRGSAVSGSVTIGCSLDNSGNPVGGFTGDITTNPVTIYPYTVHFDANGGTGSMTDQELMNGVAANLTAGTFTKDGSLFAGWNTAADGSGTSYADAQSVTNMTQTSGGTVTLYAKWTDPDNYFTNSGHAGTADDPYLISSESHWEALRTNVNGGMTYSGQYFKLTNNISVTTMVGVSGHTFNGTFDGDGHTITVNYDTYAEFCGPFAYTYGATIKNLITAGSITTSNKHAGGVVGRNGGASLKLYNVKSDVTINSNYSGSAEHGGLVGYAIIADIRDCAFTGKLLGSSSNGCGGLVGWMANDANTSVSITNCLFAPKEVTVSASDASTLARNDNNKTLDITNCYYKTQFGTAQGTNASSMSNEQLCAALGSSWKIRNDEVVPIMATYTLSGNGTEQSPYLIASADDWNGLADNVVLGNTYSGKYFLLSDDISVSRMVGTVNYEFSGTFDGNGKTLTFTATPTAGATAPFRFVNGATIRDLVIDGSITTSFKNAASLIGRARGTTAITNCVSTVTINSSVEGDGTNGGFVGYISEGTTSIEGCIFNGKLLGENTHSWGGFVGWVSEGAQGNITNCIFNPTGVSQNREYSYTFIRHSGNNFTVTNCYYSDVLTFEQGKRYHSIEGSEHLRFEFADAPQNYYDVSGITSYPVGFKLNDVFYAGIRDNNFDHPGDYVNVNLILEDGYSCSGYKVVSATNSPIDDYEFNNVITGSGNPYELYVYYRDNIRFEPTGLSIMNFAGNGSEGSPYLIEYSVQWEKLSSMSTAETTGKYFKLMIDLDNVTTKVDAEFAGTFDGNGHTITIAYGSADNYLGDEYVAPFRYAKGAVIKNLHVAGDIYTQSTHAAGIIGKSTVDATHPNTITNCRSSVTIHGIFRSYGFHGGFVACNEGVPSEQEGGALNIIGCLFDGSFIYGTESCGGFVGSIGTYVTQSINIQDCLFKPTAIDLSNPSTDYNTFVYTSQKIITLQRSYYTQAFGDEEGIKAYVLTAQPANLGEAGTAYNVSGITPYANGLGQDGKYYIGTIGLYNNQSNADLISDIATNYSSENVNVTLQGRTLYKDGDWNTLCLPFDLNSLDGTPLQGATLMELGNSNGCNTGFDATTGTLTLDFVEANKIEAGHAYLVRWGTPEAPVGGIIENPVFNGVTVENEDPADNKVISQDKAVTFQGTYNPTPIEQNDKCSLFLGENNTLYYPTTANYSVGAFRAYFHVDLNAGQEVKSFVLNFNEETGVFDVRGKMEDGRGDGVIYNIAGQRLNKLQRGINIVNGHKIVIK